MKFAYISVFCSASSITNENKLAKKCLAFFSTENISSHVGKSVTEMPIFNGVTVKQGQYSIDSLVYDQQLEPVSLYEKEDGIYHPVDERSRALNHKKEILAITLWNACSLYVQ